MNLKEGEIICDKCKGAGSTKVKRDPRRSGPYHPTMICIKCLGEGKIDWIENIIGVKARYFNFQHPLPKIDIDCLKGFTFQITPKSK